MVDEDKDSVAAGTILRYRKGEKLRVLSACHVTCIVNTVSYVKLVNGTLVTVKVIKGDKVSDLSLLESLEPMKESGTEVELSDRDPFIGEEVIVIGTPAGDERTVSIGHIGNILKNSKNLYRYRVEASTYYGSSGGGVFTRENKLIGVLIAGKLHIVTVAEIPFPAGFIPGAGIATTIQDIRKLLN